MQQTAVASGAANGQNPAPSTAASGGPGGSEGLSYCSVYTHKGGKVMRASDYGYKAWPFRPGGKKKK